MGSARYCPRVPVLPALLALLALLTLLTLLASAAAAAVERPRCPTATKCAMRNDASERFIFDINGNEEVYIEFEETKHFILNCPQNTAANDPALPVLPRRINFHTAKFLDCKLPNVSYADTLDALNVTVKNKLELTLPPSQSTLNHVHSTGLRVSVLKIESPPENSPSAINLTSFVSGLPKLRNLELINVALARGDLRRLPDTLHTLSLIIDNLLDDEPKAPPWLTRLRSLHSLTLVGRNPKVPLALAVPRLANCPQLAYVFLQQQLLSLPERWLEGSAVKMLTLGSCGLTKLPRDMFQGANVTELYLYGNKLTNLTNEVFAPLHMTLHTLDLSDNALDGASVGLAVRPLENLTKLILRNNPLGSLCGGSSSNELSPLPRSLQWLDLSNTGAARVCPDWVRGADALAHIDLTFNDIKLLTYDDLAMYRKEPRFVNLMLDNNALREVMVNESHLAACRAESRTPPVPGQSARALVQLSLHALACNCTNFVLRKALRDCDHLLKLETDVPCEPESLTPARRSLLAHDPDELLCSYKGFCMSECTCGKRKGDNATVVHCAGKLPPDPRWPPSAASYPLALHVAGTGLRAVPSREFLVEFYAANNSIPSLDEIPKSLQALDVRNNSIAHISEAAARRLGELARGARLANNTLACACADWPAILRLNNISNQVDLKELRCQRGAYVTELTEDELCAGALPVLLGVLCPLLALLALAPWVLRRLRPRLKQFLFDRQLCLRWVLSVEDAADDPDKTHDAFVSYAYADRALAAELVRRLEARGYSTVEHSRDWLPGAAVAEHIARSVLCARRTLLLVTDSFAASAWGLQEFRAAHAHALRSGSARVLPVRCRLRAPHALPPDLALYLATNTYLDWADAAFWDKLWRAMPPRARPAPGAPGARPAPPADKEPPLSEQIAMTPCAPAAC